MTPTLTPDQLAAICAIPWANLCVRSIHQVTDGKINRHHVLAAYVREEFSTYNGPTPPAIFTPQQLEMIEKIFTSQEIASERLNIHIERLSEIMERLDSTLTRLDSILAAR